jgi:hypothetical protein
MGGGLVLDDEWGTTFALKPDAKEPLKVSVKRATEVVEIVVPKEITASNPAVLAFEWN